MSTRIRDIAAIIILGVTILLLAWVVGAWLTSPMPDPAEAPLWAVGAI